MNFFNAIVIGFVQGVGEFLPISSSGHLVLLYQLFNITGDTVVISIFLHIATLFSVLYVYRKQLIELIKHPFCKTNKLLIYATIPTVILAILFKGLITSSFENNFVIFGFLFTAVVLGVADYLTENTQLVTLTNISNNNNSILIKSLPNTYSLNNSNDIVCSKSKLLQEKNDITNINLSLKQVLIMGIAQGIACFPGISRSGSTIATGLILKGDKEEVTTFSFLLSIPVIIGSLVFSFIDLQPSAIKISTFSLITSCLISFLVGIVSISLINSVVKKQKLSYFSFYLIGLVFLVLLIKFIF